MTRISGVYRLCIILVGCRGNAFQEDYNIKENYREFITKIVSLQSWWVVTGAIRCVATKKIPAQAAAVVLILLYMVRAVDHVGESTPNVICSEESLTHLKYR